MPTSNETPKPQALPPIKQFTLDEEIDELGREIGLRINVYAKRVAAGQMKQEDADYHLGVMKSAWNRMKALRYLLSNLSLPF